MEKAWTFRPDFGPRYGVFDTTQIAKNLTVFTVFHHKSPWNLQKLACFWACENTKNNSIGQWRCGMNFVFKSIWPTWLKGLKLKLEASLTWRKPYEIRWFLHLKIPLQYVIQCLHHFTSVYLLFQIHCFVGSGKKNRTKKHISNTSKHTHTKCLDVSYSYTYIYSRTPWFVLDWDHLGNIP